MTGRGRGDLFSYELASASAEMPQRYGDCVIKGDFIHRFSGQPRMIHRACVAPPEGEVPLYRVQDDVYAVVALDGPLVMVVGPDASDDSPEVTVVPRGHVFVLAPRHRFSDPYSLEGSATAMEIGARRLPAGTLAPGSAEPSALHGAELAHRSTALSRAFDDHARRATSARPLAVEPWSPGDARRIDAIPLLRATPENIRDYASLSRGRDGDQGFECEGEVVLHTYRYGPRPGLQREIEYHLGFTQTFLPLDAEMVIVLGRPNHHTDPSRRLPSELTGFIVAPGCCVQLHRGTWHDFPMAYRGVVTVLTTIEQSLYGADYETWGEGDMFKRYLDRVSEVAWALDLDPPVA
jgi:ureidoglycolate lyase